jgi:hypothetical protein
MQINQTSDRPSSGNMCRAWSSVGLVTWRELFCILAFYPSQDARSRSWDMNHQTADRLASSLSPSLNTPSKITVFWITKPWSLASVQFSGLRNREVWKVGTKVSEEYTSFVFRATDKCNWFHIHGRIWGVYIPPKVGTYYQIRVA